MKKNIFKTIAIVIAAAMLFSMTAFAGEEEKTVFKVGICN